ncbi:hypothetical protein WJX77_001997 [Trebouxia sp. C0004]
MYSHPRSPPASHMFPNPSPPPPHTPNARSDHPDYGHDLNPPQPQSLTYTPGTHACQTHTHPYHPHPPFQYTNINPAGISRHKMLAPIPHGQPQQRPHTATPPPITPPTRTHPPSK